MHERIDDVMSIMKGGKVKRYHAETLVGPLQKVAEHSWGVAVLVDMLWPDASKELILAAIYHDTHEGEIGDIPAPTKRMISQATQILQQAEDIFHEKTQTTYEANLTAMDKERLKIADYLELVLFCQHQVRMGNTHIKQVGKRGVEYVEDILDNSATGLISKDSYILATTILCS